MKGKEKWKNNDEIFTIQNVLHNNVTHFTCDTSKTPIFSKILYLLYFILFEDKTFRRL